MANPNVPQGVLNRLIASVTFPDFPSLDVTASYLAPEAISINPEGAPTANLPTLTGIVASPEPWQMFRIELNLLRSQAFADVWKQQIETNSVLGLAIVRPDSVVMSPWQISNTSLTGVSGMGFGGRDPKFTVNLTGAWQINSSLWG